MKQSLGVIQFDWSIYTKLSETGCTGNVRMEGIVSVDSRTKIGENRS